MSTAKFIQASPLEGNNTVCIVQISRPPVNAFHQAMWEELGRTFDQISRDGDIRVVVLASSLTKLWTAGLDLLSVSESPLAGTGVDPARKSVGIADHILQFQAAISAIERCKKPVIGAAHGLAIGLGIDILCACDIRYAAEDSRFSIKEVDIGIAADIGTLARLPKIVGNESAVRELALTGREFYAEEASQIGFVSKVVKGSRDAVLAAAIETAKVIASKSPVAVTGTKHLLLHARDHSVRDNLEYTATWNSLMLQTEDMASAMAAARTKKVPVFKPMPKL